jgi:amidohydrolase
MSNEMLKRAKELKSEIMRLRRAIHRHPELGFEEVKTAALVAQALESLGIRVRTGVAKTGVVGYLGSEGSTVAIRADMDALPIQELNEAPYRSQVPGVMHACGHDAHVAMALGAAMLLAGRGLPGQVRFLFQPSEEKQDEEGRTGAGRMVEGGAMEGVEAIIALHVDSETTDTGFIRISPGAMCAAVDTFSATIRGEGCHGASPHSGRDPIFISGQVVGAVHGIVSRHIDPMKPAVISIGAIHGGTAANVIPSEVTLEGTIRSLDEEVRVELHAELERAFEVARALGGDYCLTIQRGEPVMVNDEKVSELVRQVALDLLGEGHILPVEPEMGGEDFSILAREAPGAMFYLGTKRKGEMRLAHNPHFDIDEEALPIGAAILTESVLRYLASATMSPSQDV